METMAERYVRYYRDWVDMTPEQHEHTGHNFTDFADYARDRAEADGVALTYIGWWNCKPCTESQGVVIPNTRSVFAVMEFDDGSFAMSPKHLGYGLPALQWITGRPQ